MASELASDKAACSVLRTDNTARVRDGYARTSTNDHARARWTRPEPLFSRTNVLANDRACTPLPPQNLHGKEGVDGSSPSESFGKGQQMAFLLPLREMTLSRATGNLSPRPVPSVKDGHLLGLNNRIEGHGAPP